MYSDAEKNTYAIRVFIYFIQKYTQILWSIYVYIEGKLFHLSPFQFQVVTLQTVEM